MGHVMESAIQTKVSNRYSNIATEEDGIIAAQFAAKVGYPFVQLPIDLASRTTARGADAHRLDGQQQQRLLCVH